MGQNDPVAQQRARRNLVPLIIFLMIILLGAAFLGYRFRRNIFRLVGITPALTPPACQTVGQTWTSPIDGMVMVCVPAGDFLMGADDSIADALERERPQRNVTVDAFWIDKTEVTNKQFAKFVQSTDYFTWAESKRHRSYVFSEDPDIVWNDMKGANWNHPQGPQSDLRGLENHPVVHMHKDDAISYCKWAKRRLPSEAEWEKAARGGDGRLFPWGNQPWADDLANIADRSLEMVKWADLDIDDGYRYTSPAGNYPAGASPYGALDMAGNVWEVVSDWSDWYVSDDEPADVGKQMPVIRGSSWYGNAWEAHTFHRAIPDPNKSSVVTGFRCAADSTK